MLTVYSDRPAASLKDWLILDYQDGKHVVLADYNNREDAFWAFFCLVAERKVGFTFPKPKEACHVTVRV